MPSAPSAARRQRPPDPSRSSRPLRPLRGECSTPRNEKQSPRRERSPARRARSERWSFARSAHDGCQGRGSLDRRESDQAPGRRPSHPLFFFPPRPAGRTPRIVRPAGRGIQPCSPGACSQMLAAPLATIVRPKRAKKRTRPSLAPSAARPCPSPRLHADRIPSPRFSAALRGESSPLRLAAPELRGARTRPSRGAPGLRGATTGLRGRRTGPSGGAPKLRARRTGLRGAAPPPSASRGGQRARTLPPSGSRGGFPGSSGVISEPMGAWWKYGPGPRRWCARFRVGRGAERGGHAPAHLFWGSGRIRPGSPATAPRPWSIA